MSNFNPFRLAIGFLTLVLVTAGNAKFARADNVQTFNFSGIVTSFNGSDTVTGTFTLDTTNATITAFAVMCCFLSAVAPLSCVTSRDISLFFATLFSV